MSDEIAGAVVTLTEKSAQAALETAKIAGQAAKAGFNISVKTVEMIAKLLEDLFGKTAEKIRNGSDLTDIKPGQVSITKLFENARSLGDSIQFSEQGVSKEDAGKMATLAKKYAIPIAFEHDEANDCYYPRVRGSDKDVFEQICKDILRDNLNSKSSLMGSKEVAEWEVPYISKVMSSSDLPMQFAKMNDGKVYALYDKADEKAVNMAFANYEKMANEADERFDISYNPDGGFTQIKDQQTGRELSIDTFGSFFTDGELPLPTNFDTLQQTLARRFNIDETTAAFVATKFGAELTNKTKSEFFNNSSSGSFAKIASNITVKDESILVKDYTCLQLTTREPARSYVVFRDSKGQFAVLQPEKMTRKQMGKAITENLGVTEQKVLDALIDKADKVMRQSQIEMGSFKLSATIRGTDNEDRLNNVNRFRYWFLGCEDSLDELVAASEADLHPKFTLSAIRTGENSATIVVDPGPTLDPLSPADSYKKYPNLTQDCIERFDVSLDHTGVARLKQEFMEAGISLADVPSSDIFKDLTGQSAERVPRITAHIKNADQDFWIATLPCGKIDPSLVGANVPYESYTAFSLDDPDSAVKKITSEFSSDFSSISEESARAVVEKAQEMDQDGMVGFFEVEAQEYASDVGIEAPDGQRYFPEAEESAELAAPEASESEPDVPDLGNLADNDVDVDVDEDVEVRSAGRGGR